jgi:hypothetical protein
MNFQDLNDLDGLQFMPVTVKKQPVVKGWQTLFKKHNLINCEAVGLVCGKLSGNVEVIDIDLKYSLDGLLYENYKRLINEINPEIIKKLVIQKTMNGGYHFIYRCEKIEGNLKLASRSTTNDEKNKTYLEELSKGATKEESKKRATNDKVRVLLETRGEGGMIVCYPSKGYEFVQGDWYSITELTLDERETLFNIARQFNEVIEDYRPQQKADNRIGVKGLSPFEDYNDRGDVISLLERNGWKVVKNQGKKTLLLRPGQTSATHSGNYDFDKKWFSVFTTSTEFEPQKAYQPYAVYAILECNKDFSKAAKQLYDEGYGERREVERELNQKTPSRVNLTNDDYSFVATEEDYGEYLRLARAGKLPMGLTTGSSEIDKYFLFKPADMIMINGEDNVGKTAVIVFFALVSSLLHKWNWILYASENSEGSIMRRLIEFYWGKKINEQNDIEYGIAYEFVTSNFTLIKTDEQLYNYRDIINMTKKLLKKKVYHSVLIDPYNSLKTEMSNNKMTTHDYHYEAISEIKMFGKKNKIGFWINNHVITGALRNKDENGYTKPPSKADTEGGGKFSNKADGFLTIHRHLQHPKEWMITEIHNRKVKETETGGRVTPQLQPIKMTLNKNMCGFTVMNEMGYSCDPIATFQSKNKPTQTEIILPTFNNWEPYTDNGEPDPF